jgi:hypothetical protein
MITIMQLLQLYDHSSYPLNRFNLHRSLYGQVPTDTNVLHGSCLYLDPESNRASDADRGVSVKNNNFQIINKEVTVFYFDDNKL